MKTDRFQIPLEYKCRLDNAAFDDTPLKDEWQRSVYQYARQMCGREGWRSVVDVGCGSGYKLATLFNGLDATGLDLAPTIEFCRRTYPGPRWEVIDMERPLALHPDLVICADVIEHIPDPDVLLGYIKALGPLMLVVSTPARELLPLGPDELMGPPKNPHHVREWSSSEFCAYMDDHFEILDHVVAPAGDPVCQFICARLR